MMHCKFQIVFDKGLFSNTNTLFKDFRWIKPYNRTVDSYGTLNSNDQTAQLRLDRLKIDQVLPVSIFGRSWHRYLTLTSHRTPYVKQQQQEQKQQQQQ